MAKFCIKCGKQINNDALFCKYCGAKQNTKSKYRLNISEIDILSNRKIVVPVGVAAFACLCILSLLLVLGKNNDTLPTTVMSTTDGGPEGVVFEYGVNSSNRRKTSPGEVILVADGSVEFNGHHYKVVNEGSSWGDAKQRCEADGGHLVTINSSDEHEFIVNLLESDGLQKCHYWLGGTDKEEEGKWKWVTGEPFEYTKWDPGDGDEHDPQPNDYDNQDYIELQTISNTGSNYMTWNDMCESGDNGSNQRAPWYYMQPYFGYICEWEY